MCVCLAAFRSLAAHTKSRYLGRGCIERLEPELKTHRGLISEVEYLDEIKAVVEMILGYLSRDDVASIAEKIPFNDCHFKGTVQRILTGVNTMLK